MTDNELNYYADTAYNSEKPRDLPPARDRGDDGYFLNKSLGKPVNLPKKSHCQEFLGLETAGHWHKVAKRRGIWSRPPSQEDGPHVKKIWGNIFEWPVFIRMLNHIFGVMLLIGGGGVSIMSLLPSGPSAEEVFFFLFFPVSIWIIVKFLTRKEPKLKTDTRFLRRTGMVSIYLGKGNRQEIPFDEFDPYVSFTTGPTGSSNLVLNLVHRYSNTAVGYHNSFMFEEDLKAEWEQLCDFMDISRPLPETPVYERCRHWDPVSRMYDEQHNRTKDYWFNMSKGAIHALSIHSYRAIREYPWGQTRQQALAKGWKPSEQRWREAQNERQQAQTDDAL